jgi:hypothetical protein
MLHDILASHPDIFMSRNKEPWFFALGANTQAFTGPGDGQGVRERDAYLSLFANRGTAAVVGEASTLYLASPIAPRAVQQEVPEAKIVAILRNPVDRAFSNYTQHRWQGRETLTFEAAVAAGPERVSSGWAPFWDYRAMSNYGEQLDRWYSRFPRDQIKIIFFDDLISDQGSTIADLFRFLDVRDMELSVVRGQVNAAGVPKWSRLHALLRRSSRSKRILQSVMPRKLSATLRAEIDKRNRGEAGQPSIEISAQLTAGYQDQLALTEYLIDRKLPPWVS